MVRQELAVVILAAFVVHACSALHRCRCLIKPVLTTQQWVHHDRQLGQVDHCGRDVTGDKHHVAEVAGLGHQTAVDWVTQELQLTLDVTHHISDVGSRRIGCLLTNCSNGGFHWVGVLQITKLLRHLAGNVCIGLEHIFIKASHTFTLAKLLTQRLGWEQ